MTPADRRIIAAALRERLPEGWEVEVKPWAVAGHGADLEIRVWKDRTWLVSQRTWLPDGGSRWDPDEGGPVKGRGWRERLVDDVVAAVEEVERG